MSSPLPRTHAAPKKRRLRRILFVTGLVAVLGLSVTPTLTDSSWGDLISAKASGPEPLIGVPADDPGAGLVFDGLRPAPKGNKCVGEYLVGGSDLCSHGPDPAPAGLNPRGEVKPVAAARPADKAPAPGVLALPSVTDLATSVGALAPVTGDSPLVAAADTPPGAPIAPAASGVVCDGDGRTGKRVQMLYGYESGKASRFNEYVNSFRTWSAGIEKIYDSSAQQTGGSRHVRFVTTPDCAVDVLAVELPAGSFGNFDATINALKKLGYAAKDRKYVLFAESKVYCGIGTLYTDHRPGQENTNNNVASYSRVDSGCWGAAVAAHELTHNLGSVQNNSPNHTEYGHCTDDYDLMCYNDGAGTVMRTVCTDKANEDRLDCNNDDYFTTSAKPGSYLATNWNVANSGWLITGTGGPNPNPSPSPSASTGPSPTGKPTAKPSPSASAQPTQTAGPSPTKSGTPRPTVTVRDIRQTSVGLTWPAGATGTRYTVVFNGRAIGTTGSTAVRVTGLRPGTEYRVSITVGSAAYAPEVTFRTAAASAPTGKELTMANAYTGQNVDLTASRRTDGAPIIAYAPHGYANQRWVLVPAAGDTLQIRSVASGKCVSALGQAAAGVPLVQHTCDAQAVGQRWKLTLNPDGYALSLGGFDVGIGEGGQLVLQAPSQARAQRWSLTSS
ncbi:RICIN domain-containing protein [Longispora sp. NPDC051575]|uniref:RICIN domain-containing protein n=1 Tax=Longispora sp. NPDC051575 TaxID=3154943 RepID=UPI0034337B47